MLPRTHHHADDVANLRFLLIAFALGLLFSPAVIAQVHPTRPRQSNVVKAEGKILVLNSGTAIEQKIARRGRVLP